MSIAVNAEPSSSAAKQSSERYPSNSISMKMPEPPTSLEETQQLSRLDIDIFAPKGARWSSAR